jgi:hypothetical protein
MWRGVELGRRGRKRQLEREDAYWRLIGAGVGTAEVPVVIEGTPDVGAIEVREAEEDPPARLAAFRDGEVIGYVRSEHHDDVSRLLAIGVPLSITLMEEGAMRIHVNDPTERTAWLGQDGQ